MQRDRTQSNKGGSGHAQTFAPVLDSRKRKIRGLWQRGSRYYAQLRVDLGNGRTAPRRLPLEAANLEEAKGELERKRTERRDGKLPQTGHRPKFEEFTKGYFACAAFAKKKLGTQKLERWAIGRWVSHLGGVRVDKITPAMIYSYREARLKLGRTARTANLDTIALRNVLKLARERELLSRLPEIHQLKHESTREEHPLLTKEQIAVLLEATTEETTKYAALLRFYLRFLALTGAREQETLRVPWVNVNFEDETVTIGSGGTSKNRRIRRVDFSPELTVLLQEMAVARPPDCSWLFPSPQRGARDVAARNLRAGFNKVREKAGLPKMGFHDLRHFFASQCVMAGLDYMTIAKWLGHSDGGILVGSVYGHVTKTHTKGAAKTLRLLTT